MKIRMQFVIVIVFFVIALIPILNNGYVSGFFDAIGFNQPEQVPPQPSGSTQIIPTFTVKPAADTKPVIPAEVTFVEQSTTPAATLTETLTLVPTTTQTATHTTTGTSAPPCLVPLSPPKDNSFGSFGKVTFSWEANIDASSYAVIVTAPGGTVMTFPAASTTYSRWIESFPWGGEFTWQVAALDGTGNTLCLSSLTHFTKKVTEPSYTAVPQGSDPTPRSKKSTPFK